MDRSTHIIFGEVLQPGETIQGGGDLYTGPKTTETKKLPTPEQEKEFLNKYGCNAQSGKLFLSVVSTDMEDPSVIFSKTSGVADNAVRTFLVGNPNGMYPLKEKIYPAPQY